MYESSAVRDNRTSSAFSYYKENIMRYLILLVLFLMPQPVFAAGNTLEWLPSNLRLCTNTPGSSNADDCEIAADGKFVVVVWDDNRNGSEHIYCNVSTDGGTTWQADDIRLNTSIAGDSRSIKPAVAVSGSRAWVAWVDTRFGSADIFVNYSSDYGQTWLPSDIRLNLGSTQGDKLCWETQVHASGNNVYVTWIETRFGYVEGLFLNYSLDGGSTWQPTDVQIDDGVADVSFWQIVADGATVYAMWWANGINIYFNRSLDNGAHWMDSDHRVNVSDGDNSDPVFAVEGSTIYVFWDRYNSGKQINFNHSHDGGVSWDQTDTEMPFGANPQLALANGVVHLSNLQNDRIYYRQYRSESGWKDPIAVRDFDVKDFDLPILVVNDSLVFLAWYDMSCLDQSIRCNYSMDRGRSFASVSAPYIYLNDNACMMTAIADDPRAAISGDNVYVVWKDSRNIKTDIYFTTSTIPGKALPFLYLLMD